MQPQLATQLVHDFANKVVYTGTTSQRNGTAFTVNRLYTLFVGEEAVRINQGGGSVTAASTDVYLPAGSQWTFQVDNGGDYLAIIHEDGSTTFRCHVVPSSPAP